MITCALQGLKKMDGDVSWANFNSFDSGANNGGSGQWRTEPPDGSVLHASPRKPGAESKYSLAGVEYVVEEENGMVCDEKLPSDSEVPGEMITS